MDFSTCSIKGSEFQLGVRARQDLETILDGKMRLYMVTYYLAMNTFSVSAVVSFSAQLMSIMVLAYVCTLSTPLWLLRFTAVTQNANLCDDKL